MHILPMRPANEWPQKISTRSWPQGGVEELHKVFKGMQNALNKVLKRSAPNRDPGKWVPVSSPP